MGIGTAISIEEYLETSYEGSDREYREGEVVERNMGATPHAIAQNNLGWIFTNHRESLRLFSRTEQRLRLNRDRVLVPDVCVFFGQPPRDAVPSTPPLIAVEIVSSGDRMSDVLAKLGEYASWGVKHIWLADPQVRKLFVYAKGKLNEVDRFELDEPHLIVEPAEIFDE